jgi:hypothetical protein
VDAVPTRDTKQYGDSDQHKHADVFCIWHGIGVWNTNWCYHFNADTEQDGDQHTFQNRNIVYLLFLVKYSGDHRHGNSGYYRDWNANGNANTLLHGYDQWNIQSDNKSDRRGYSHTYKYSQHESHEKQNDDRNWRSHWFLHTDKNGDRGANRDKHSYGDWNGIRFAQHWKHEHRNGHKDAASHRNTDRNHNRNDDRNGNGPAYNAIVHRNANRYRCVYDI